MTKHGLDHAMCGGCWIERHSARLPLTLGFDEPVTCCWCGRLTSSGIVHWSVHAPKCEESPR